VSQQHLHIVALDVPLPADYGGVMDIFYKIAWLHKLGIKIHLHCFSSGRPPQDELDSYCEEVFYYKRKNFLQSLPIRIPYMVGSRDNAALLKNLQEDDFPVLLEGIQCSYLLHTGALQNRKVFLRLHNTEFLYYEKLASYENNFLKRWYFKNESRLLKKYEKEICDKAPVLALSKSDINLYKRFFKALKIIFIPAFSAWDKISSLEGRGTFCLYHGNLGINENEKAVEWLLESVFKNSDIPLVVAGKRPSDDLQACISKHPNCVLVENPTNIELQDLVQKAQVNILPSFNNTGVKLKLLNALYNGRHCLVNTAAIDGAAVPTLCEVADTAEDFAKKASLLFEKDFTAEDILHRSKVLAAFYDNENNAMSIIKMLED
jgi:hypothetical protein